jgi:thioredoxin 1
MAEDLNRDTYDKEVKEVEIPVLVDFWGPQCGPCLALMPAVDRLEEKYKGKIKVAKVNAVENRMLCAKLRVLGLPSYLFYKEGVEQKRLTGNQLTERDLEEGIKELLT